MSKAFNASQPDRSLESIPCPPLSQINRPCLCFHTGSSWGFLFLEPTASPPKPVPLLMAFAQALSHGLFLVLPLTFTFLHLCGPPPPTPDHEPTENRNLDLVVSAPIRVSLRHTPALPSRTPEPPAFLCVIFIAPQSTQCSRNRVRDGPQLR